jgi:hypothetical protein
VGVATPPREPLGAQSSYTQELNFASLTYEWGLTIREEASPHPSQRREHFDA